MADTPKHSVSVAGIVVDNNDRVLVIQRRDNLHWEPPGGVLEVAETPENGVRREIEEETGICVDVEHLTGVYKNMSQGIVSLVFRCKVRGGVATSTAESAQVRWVSVAEACESMKPAFAIRVRDAFAAKTASVRVHDGVDIIASQESARSDS